MSSPIKPKPFSNSNTSSNSTSPTAPSTLSLPARSKNATITSTAPAPAPATPPATASATAVAAPIPDQEDAASDLPLTMSASVVLTALPRDATAALASAGSFEREKVIVRFKAVGSAPILRQQVCKIGAAQRFEQVVAYLRRVLRCKPEDSVFLYINQAFAPALDEIVGNLHRCFRNHADDQLVVAYSMTPAFG